MVDSTTLQPSAAWYCLRSQPKRERVAAGDLRRLDGVEVFLPQVRLTRYRQRGPVKLLEPMFPNYLFARFDSSTQQRAVRYAKGVAYIVSKGDDPQSVSEAIIDELRALTVDDVFELQPEPLQIGEQVRIVRGIFAESQGAVMGLRSAAERVVLLMELLGREQEIELPLDAIERSYQMPI